MAHIAIDARKYFDFGIGSYIQNLAKSLAELKVRHSFTLFLTPADRPKVPAPDGWRILESSYGKYSIGEIAMFASDVQSGGIDLLHEPHYTLPIRLRRKSVVTIHDLTHLKLPDQFSPLQRAYAKAMIDHAVRHAGAVIAVSEATRADLISEFGLQENDVHVVHNGISAQYRKLDDSDGVRFFRESHRLESPFILYVGNVKPHKNIPTLLTAFAGVHRSHKELDLVFAGGACLSDPALSAQAERLGIVQNVRDVGRLTEQDLVRVYNDARVLVLPSFYEGFGFPALEAMACGTPAIVSNAGSLPEVVGDAALIVDPSDPEGLAEAMRSLLDKSELRATMTAKGWANVRRFTWESTARKTLQIYEDTLSK